MKASMLRRIVLRGMAVQQMVHQRLQEELGARIMLQNRQRQLRGEQTSLEYSLHGKKKLLFYY